MYRFIKFLFVGGLNTLFGLLVYIGAFKLGAAVWLAILIGNLSGIVFNFFTTGGLVFRSLDARRLPRFVLAYLMVYGINLLSMHWLVPHWGALPAQVILTPPLVVLSYVLMSRFVFVVRTGHDSGPR
ncbi:putative flippase GtrA [Silvimonas terrae]|uniref:Putative flippase GtrA n=1 Tax=Silvimonas terrae TaxID=300266 RepID=A0A840RH17_9NEIS|nr:GtrA family protein [Silvimonas terrae]MBB5192357.1 putative flippase GtrA [Silvimonas terrae]